MKSYNAIEMKGRLYNYSLDTLETEKGTAVWGNVILEVDADGTTVTVQYFANPFYNSGKPNKTYDMLEAIMKGGYCTVVDNGEDAEWLALTGSVDTQYFKARNSQDGELARSQRLRGAFINPNKDKKYQNRWKMDMLITDIKEIEADEEKKLPRYLKVSGFYIDDYRERVMEVAMDARSEQAINYIVGLDASFAAPYFVSTWGTQSKTTTIRLTKNAFGEDEETEYSNTRWLISGMSPTPYDWDDEKTMTEETYAAYREGLETYKQEVLEKDDSSDKDSGTTELAF